jgi:hypothetical protein
MNKINGFVKNQVVPPGLSPFIYDYPKLELEPR